MSSLYILKSLNHNKTYVGITDDLEKRLQEHNSGKSIYTSKFKPWKIIHYEKCENKEEARKREKYYKSTSGRKKIKNLIYSPIAQR